ncbi:MAG TPA: GntR family transcriptional regulator [Nocardioides sp.]|nr:GntR family transcriptional regulator [Nocardioides sp.]
MIDDGRPIFRQIAERIAAQILDGTLGEESQVPSTNEFAAIHRINPATAAKGVNELVDAGVLYKKRGIGMFVATGARDRLLAERRAQFAAEYVEPMLREAARLGIHPDELRHLVTEQEVTA